MLITRLCPIGLLLAFGLSAQSHTFESLNAKWTHALGAPNWTDNVPSTSADFATVSQLNSAPLLDYTSTPIPVQPGNYSAAIRVQKLTDQTGAYPLVLTVSVNGVLHSAELPVAAQKPDTWVLTPSVEFKVTQPNSVLVFKLQGFSQGSIQVQNYQFDSFALGTTHPGSVMVYESLARTWWHAWSNPYYNEDVTDLDSAFGKTDQLNNVWWLEFGSPDYYLPAGSYVATARVKKQQNATNAVPLDLIVDVGGNKTTVTLPVSSQTIDTYVLTPELAFTVPGPTTKVTFWLRNIASTYKQFYAFDAFEIRAVPGLTAYGTACATSLGTPALGGDAPRIGEVCKLATDKVPGQAWFFVGAQQQSIDLSVIGMTGCKLLCDTPILIAAQANASNVASISFPVPNDPALLFVEFYSQTLIRDPQANTFGFATSNGAKAVVGN